jgi:hypothetical protein
VCFWSLFHKEFIMPRSPIAQFTAPNGAFYLVNTQSDGKVYGPFFSKKEIRAARAAIPAHEHSNTRSRAFFDGVPAADADVNPLTR